MKIKVLSIRQPYAEWIISGKKTIELRTWNTKFRGKFYIHASGKHKTLPTGVIIGYADLIDVKEYKNKEDFLKDKNKHCSDTRLLPEFAKRPFKYGFILKNAKRIKPIPAKGKLGFWNYEIR